MTVEEEEQKKGEGKGFAGLSSLMSDVDTPPPPPVPKKAPAAATQPAQPQPSQRQTYQEHALPSSGGSSGGKWMVGIAAVIGVLWLIDQSNKPATTSAPPSYSPPAQSTTPSQLPPVQPQAPSQPRESKPPVGQGLSLSYDQIAYCVAEDIRMDGAKSALNSDSNYEVDHFNAMVTDYNSRCANFRYRRGSLESVHSSIEPWRSQLESEGKSRFSRPTTDSLSAQVPPDSSTTESFSTTESSDQIRTTHLGLELLSFDEKDAIETACILMRNEGAASYNRCVATQLRVLGR